MKHLYFVRHGESELNRQRLFTGRIDSPLSAHGEQQAFAAIAQAKTLGIDLIVSSPLIRALKTAQIIAEGIDYPVDRIITNDLFVERSLGSIEGKSWDEYDEDEVQYPDIESLHDLYLRAEEGLRYLQSLDADTILLAGHGSYSRELRAAINGGLEYPEPENAEIVRLI